MMPIAGTIVNAAIGARFGGNVPAGGTSTTITERSFMVAIASPLTGLAVTRNFPSEVGSTLGAGGAATVMRAIPAPSVTDCCDDGSMTCRSMTPT